MLTSSPPACPGAKDLDEIGSPITYPTTYLSEYKTRTVIAEKNGLSCVIYRDADGYMRSGWVTSSHLVVQ